MGDKHTFTIDELADAAGMTPRNVRAYRTKGLLPPPIRAGRSSSYRGDHLERLRHIKELRGTGLPLKLIMEAAQRGDDLSPTGPLSMLTSTFAEPPGNQTVVDVAALELDQTMQEETAALLPPGSPVALLAERLTRHGVTQPTVLVMLLRASRSGRALSEDLAELLCHDLLTARPHELPTPLLDDTMELVVRLTQQAFAQSLPVTFRL